MRLSQDARAWHLLRRLQPNGIYVAVELALLALLAVQCARLIWAAVTPVGPLGDWRRNAAVAYSPAILQSFDPFFRLSQASGPAVITALDLKLYGVREDRASGRGSAIIGLPDGSQASFGVGEAIMPGVTLAGVAFDHVTIARGAVKEQLFLDQSQEVTPIAPTPAAAAPAAPSLAQAIQFEPRRQHGTITGVAVQPRGAATAFFEAGFRPGDVIVSVNGVSARSGDPAGVLAAAAVSGGTVAVEVERDGKVLPLQVKTGR